jgi:hypothetical protein
MDEGGIGLVTGKQALEGVDQNRIGSPQLNSAGLTARKYAFEESLSLVIAGVEAELAPDFREAKHPFRVVVGRPNSILAQKSPQTFRFFHQIAHKTACGILILSVSTKDVHQPDIKHRPLSLCRRFMRHPAQQLDFLQYSRAALRNGTGWMLGNGLGALNKVPKARLTPLFPFSINAYPSLTSKPLQFPTSSSNAFCERLPDLCERLRKKKKKA